jgi:hypothetical protein
MNSRSEIIGQGSPARKQAGPNTAVIVHWADGKRSQAVEGHLKACGTQKAILTIQPQSPIPSRLLLVNPATREFAFAEATWKVRQHRTALSRLG